MKKNHGSGSPALAAVISAGVVILDQATKFWASRALADGPPLTVIDNFFHLTFHFNTGGVFGLFSGSESFGKRVFFIVTTLLALALIIYFMKEWGGESLLAFTGLSLIIGGAFGNLVDRVIYGKVIDFIDWHWYGHHWPTFNIADSGITVGTVLLFFSLLTMPQDGDTKKSYTK